MYSAVLKFLSNHCFCFLSLTCFIYVEWLEKWFFGLSLGKVCFSASSLSCNQIMFLSCLIPFVDSALCFHYKLFNLIFLLSYKELYFFPASYLEQVGFNKWYFYGERQFLNIWIIRYFAKLLIQNHWKLLCFTLVVHRIRLILLGTHRFPFQNNFQWPK